MSKTTKFMRDRIDALILKNRFVEAAKFMGLETSAFRKYILRAEKEGFIMKTEVGWFKGKNHPDNMKNLLSLKDAHIKDSIANLSYNDYLKITQPEKYFSRIKKEMDAIRTKLDLMLKKSGKILIFLNEDHDKNLLRRLTFLQYDDVLPHYCYDCYNQKNLNIHHKRYTYPIIFDDLVRLCASCHSKAHSKKK